MSKKTTKSTNKDEASFSRFECLGVARMLSYSWVQRLQGDPGILIVHYYSQRIQREGEYVTNGFVSKTAFETSLTLGCRS
jgi:hypothetical protein